MVVWRRCSGTADSRETIMIPRWLQDSLGRAKLSPRWPKLAPRWSQEGLQNYLARFTRCAAALFGPILGPSWAILGPLGPLVGSPGGHLEAKFGLGRLDLGVQGGPKLRCQKHQKQLRNKQCFWPISGGKEPSGSLQSGSLEVLLWF